MKLKSGGYLSWVFCCCYYLWTIVLSLLSIDSVEAARQVIKTVLEQAQYGKDLLELPPKAVQVYLRDLVYLEFNVSCEEHEVCLHMCIF